MGLNLPKTKVKSALTGSSTAKDYQPAILSDTENQVEFRGFRVGKGGTIILTSSNNNTVSLETSDNETVPIGGVRIGADSTATGIILLY